MAFDFILLAAGKGKRLWPVTESYPKPLAKVIGKPLIGWIMEAIAPHARKIVIVTGTSGASTEGGGKREKFEQYVSTLPFRDKVYFTVQEKAMGTGDAVRVGAAQTENGAIVLNGDCFYSPSFFQQIISKAKKSESFIVGKRVVDGSNYGVISEKNGLFKGIIEKPKDPKIAKNSLISTGAFYAPKEFFQLLDGLPLSPRGEYEVTDAFNIFSQQNDFHVEAFGDSKQDYWDDVGGYWNLLEANLYAANHYGPKKPAATAEISKKAEIGEGTFIGEGVEIGAGTKIEQGAVIEDNCKIGGAKISGSLLMAGAKAAKCSLIERSAICEGTSIRENARLLSIPCTANQGTTNVTICVELYGKQIDTGRKILGSAIGSQTQIGAGTTINAGVLIGAKCRIAANSKIASNIASHS